MDQSSFLFAIVFFIIFLAVVVAFIRWLVGTQKILDKLAGVEDKISIIDVKLDAVLNDVEAAHSLQIDTDSRIADLRDKVQNIQENLYDVMHTIGYDPIGSKSRETE
ncbi:hypothetical protein [Roseibium salinum]|uniref:Phage shock protein B n=1 Tax=Roseibium salinum TaxID=1604349 RepID=A0ABT3R731_9HYPH|nr:hypothetical protein [Roseibium sp. DSM 29163]MCX2724967.1 hypothetical protein [Roseibium sp. DSM 29163]